MNGYYWIYLAMLGFLFWYEFTRQPDRKRLIYYVACGFLILLYAIQDGSVSIDIAEYMRQYAIIPDLGFGQMLTHKFEIGYVLLCWILERLFDSERVLVLAMALIILPLFAKSFRQETEDPMVALMAFLALGMYLHAIIFWRQLAAMAILTLSYRYIRQRKPIPFLLVMLAAMCFHKTAVVFLGLYIIYNIPINKWLLVGCAVLSVVLGVFGKPIIHFGISVIYPRYLPHTLESLGGGTLLALFWVVTLLSYWILRDRLDEPAVRLPFLMILIAATIQPICFAFFWWLRIVLFFRIGLVPMTALLYTAMFRDTENNRLLMLIGSISPGARERVQGWYGKAWFRVATLLALFAVLFAWYVSELDGGRYVMAPVTF